MIRVVLDTNVFASGLRSDAGASFAVLELVADRKILPLVTTALLLEYESVLTRPEQVAAQRISIQGVSSLMSEFAALAEPVEVHFLWRPMLSDANDELVLEAAINGRADALVTHNIRDFAPAVGRFGLEILKPADLLRRSRK